MKQKMRFIFYLFVLFSIFPAQAGSYEDFFRAVIADNPRSIERLVARGFDPNSVDPDGQPGLVRALHAEAFGVAMALARMPATDVDLANPAGETPLMMAAIKNQLPLAQLLLERGAQVNRPGWTPLHYAAAGNAMPVLELLLARGALVDARAPNGRTPLMMAALFGEEALVERLIAAGADLRAVDRFDRSAADLATAGDREWLGQKLAARAAKQAPR